MQTSKLRVPSVPRFLRTEGRLRRRDYALALVLMAFGLILLHAFGSAIPTMRPLIALGAFPLLGYVSFCVAAQRAHDAGLSGWVAGSMMASGFAGALLATGGALIKAEESDNANMLFAGAFALLFAAAIMNIILLFSRDAKANEWGRDPRHS